MKEPNMQQRKKDSAALFRHERHYLRVRPMAVRRVPLLAHAHAKDHAGVLSVYGALKMASAHLAMWPSPMDRFRLPQARGLFNPTGRAYGH